MLIDISILLVPIPTGKSLSDPPVFRPCRLTCQSLQVKDATSTKASRRRHIMPWVIVRVLVQN
jgi:hypothetical protein